MRGFKVIEQTWRLVLRRRRSQQIAKPFRTQAVVFKTIPPGGYGRLRHNATDWFARCDNSKMTVSKGTKVHLLWREDNTYVVQPIN